MYKMLCKSIYHYLTVSCYHLGYYVFVVVIILFCLFTVNTFGIKNLEFEPKQTKK